MRFLDWIVDNDARYYTARVVLGLAAFLGEVIILALMMLGLIKAWEMLS